MGGGLPDEPAHNVFGEMIARKLTMQPELFLIAVIDGAVVGSVMAGFDGVRGWVHKLAVRVASRRHGIGKALMQHAEAGLAHLGCPKVNLQVRATNTAVVEFYRAIGYAAEERVSMGKHVR